MQFNSTGQLGTTQTLTHFPPRGMEGKRFRRAKVRKFTGWREGNFLIKRKIKQKKKRCKIQLPTTTVNSSAMAALANSHPSSTTLHGMRWLQVTRQLSVLVLFPPSFLGTSSLLADSTVRETEKTLCLYKQCSTATETSVCYPHYRHYETKITKIQHRLGHYLNSNPILTKARTAWNVTLGWVYR